MNPTMTPKNGLKNDLFCELPNANKHSMDSFAQLDGRGCTGEF
jgi:hypothetical protein